MRFSGQGTMHKYYLVASVTGTGALLSNTFIGTEGVQVSTTRHYGGRGTPLTSKIHWTKICVLQMLSIKVEASKTNFKT